ncbi:hypothetical protein J2127_001054 [Methanococcus voltae]|uniref:hypothetical protein n=1 Tax=Methanococcus voltae TaxID=2188 RepID=UPI001AE80707|nr:hypothetical protein [Methanococcus voltae]MBP2143885.1 hypothetical protein [Methanococcus voltae]
MDITEKLLKMAKDYLNNITEDQLMDELIECGSYEIEPAPSPIYERNGYSKKESKTVPYIEEFINNTSEKCNIGYNIEYTNNGTNSSYNGEESWNLTIAF